MEENKIRKRLDRAKTAGKLEEWKRQCRLLGQLKESQGLYDEALEAYKEELSASHALDVPTEIASSHRMIGEALSALGRFEESLIHINHYLNIAKSEKDYVEEQRAMATMGRAYFCWAVDIQGNTNHLFDKSRLIDILTRCKKAYMTSLFICDDKLKDLNHRERQEMKARLYYNLGLACELEEEYGKGENFIQKAVTICKQFSLLEDLHRCYLCQTSIYIRQGDYSAALSVIDDSIEVAKRISDTNEFAVVSLLHKADVYFAMRNYTGARKVLKTAYKMRSPNSDDQKSVEVSLKRAMVLCDLEKKLLATSEEALGERKFLYEKLGDACCAVKNYKHALLFYTKMLECGLSLGEKEKDLQPCYVSLTQTYRDDKQYDLALRFARKELEITKNLPKEASRTHIGIGEILEMKGAPFSEITEEYISAHQLAVEAGHIGLQASALRRLEAIQRADGRLDLADETAKKLDYLEITSSDDSDSDTDESNADVHLSDLSDSDEEKKRTRKPTNTFRITRNEKGETPLHVAAIRGDIPRAQRLINHGHSVKVRDFSGWTPLHEAANHGHLEMVKLLVDSGADIDDAGGENCGGITPLHDAATCGHFEIVDFLMQRGALVTVLTDDGETPLDCLNGWRQRVDVLTPDSDAIFKRLSASLASSLEKAGLQGSRTKSNKKVSKQLTSQTSQEKRFKRRASNDSINLRRQSDEMNDERRPIYERSLSPDPSYRCPLIAESQIEPRLTKLNVSNEPVSDYKAAIGALRKISKRQEPVVDRPKAPLLDANTYVDDWLEDDMVDIQPRSKKQKRKATDLTNGGDLDDSFLSSINLDEISEAEDSRKKAKVNTVGAGLPPLGPTFVETTIHNGEHSEVPTPANSTFASAQRFVIQAAPSYTSSQLDSTPYIPFSSNSIDVRDFRVIVKRRTITVTVPSRQVDDLTIGWLADEVAKKYRELEGAEPVLKLKAKDGLIWSANKPLRSAIGEDIDTNILDWRTDSLTDRYRFFNRDYSFEPNTFCPKYFEDPSITILSRLEECKELRSLNLSFLALTPEEFGPVFDALKYEFSLNVLDISGNILGDDGIEMLCQFLDFCSVRHLNLRCNNISIDGLTDLCDFLETADLQTRTDFEIINLSANPLGADRSVEIKRLTDLLPNLIELIVDDSDSFFYL